MSVQTYFKKALSRKSAILACRSSESETIVETTKPHVFILEEGNLKLLAVVTDVITGQGSDNVYKVEIDVYPS